MKSTRIVCSLVVLSSPLCLNAAAFSSGMSDASHWEVKQVGSLISRTKTDLTKQPTHAALVEAKYATKFIQPLAKLNKDIYLQELKTIKSRSPHHVAPKQAPAEIIVESTCYQDCSATQRKKVLEQLAGTISPLKSTVSLYSSNGDLVDLEASKPYTHVDKGTVLAYQNYTWSPKEIKTETKTTTVWRPKYSLMSEEIMPVATTLTAMQNILTASVIDSSFYGYSTETMRAQIPLLQVISSDPNNRSAKDAAIIDAQHTFLVEKATNLFAEIGLSPKLGYYVRAILDEFRKYSENNDDKVQSYNDIFKSAFGTTAMVANNRPAVVAMYAEVLGAVQDHSATSGLWSFLGTNEPKEVSELNACNEALKSETDKTKIATLTSRRDLLINAIHTQAVTGLNSLVKQEAIITDKLRAETKHADVQIGELRNTLRQLHELQNIQSVLHEKNTHTEQHASSSSSNLN